MNARSFNSKAMYFNWNKLHEFDSGLLETAPDASLFVGVEIII
jgi:hypothetical protein